MSKSVLLSIRPEWCEKIANGKKTLEIRKTRPKIDTPFKCYIYCTYNFSNPRTRKKKTEFWIGAPLNSISKGRYIGNGKVIGEFVCDEVLEVNADDYSNGYYDILDDDLKRTRLTQKDLWEYGKGKALYAWHISDLIIYDKPKELSEFKGRTLVWRGYNHIHDYEDIKRPPQSWCYVWEREKE